MKSVISSLTERIKEMRDDRDYYKKKADGVDQETVDAIKTINKSVKEMGEIVADMQSDLRKERREHG